MKKKLLNLLLLVSVIFLLGFFLRFFSGPEDSWLCEKGQWVKHGNPDAQMPKGECGEGQLTTDN